MRFIRIKNLKLLLIISSILAGCTKKLPEFLCFSSLDESSGSLCYPLDTLAARNPLVIEAIDKLGSNLENPGNLVTMSPDMKAHYTRNKFEDSLKTYFQDINRDSIQHIVNNGPYSAILLKTGSTLYYNHDIQSFVFSFDEPIPFGGLTHHFGKGKAPVKQAFTALNSNCNLTRDGIVFTSAQKDHKLYSESGTFCEYDGYYFKEQGDSIVVRKVDQIDQGYSLISATGFTKFLLWLNES